MIIGKGQNNNYPSNVTYKEFMNKDELYSLFNETKTW